MLMPQPLPKGLSLGSKVIIDSRANLCIPERSERHIAATIQKVFIGKGQLYTDAHERSRVFDEVTRKKAAHYLSRPHR